MKPLVIQAYALFSDYSAPPTLDVCTFCCLKPEEEQELIRLDPAQLSQKQLSLYNDSASSLKTPIQELKHFLPRYLELSASFHFPSHSPELTFRRYLSSPASDWTEEEQAFLAEFGRQYFRECLRQYPLAYEESIDSLLITLDWELFQPDQLLEDWRNNLDSSPASQHFQDLEGAFSDKDSSRLVNPFASKELAQRLKAWLLSEPVAPHFQESSWSS